MPDSASDPRDQLIETIFELHHQFSSTLQNTAIPQWMGLELTMAQFKTAFVVAHRGPMMVNALAEVLGVTQSTVSHLVDRLEQANLVERVAVADDRRRTLVQLAPAGAELIETLHQGGREFLHMLLVGMDVDDLAALVRGLQAIMRVSESAHFKLKGCG